MFCTFILSILPIISVMAYKENEPDLIPELYIIGDSERNRYDIYVEVHNTGSSNAYLPARSIIARLKTKYILFGNTVITDHSETKDIILKPGEIYTDYAGSDHYFYLRGAKFTLTVDPNDIIYEGADGENNNILEKTPFPLNKHNTYSISSKINLILERVFPKFLLIKNIFNIMVI